MRIYNSLTRKTDIFKPINPPKVGMYTCGPTVHDYQHIGNFRTMILSDFLYRTLVANNYQVKSVRNITDIDDKIIKKAKEKNLPIEIFTKEYTQAFIEDLGKLNILPTSISPKATKYIEQMIKYIEELVKKGLAYVERDGSVYFDISKFPCYGKLSDLNGRTLKTGTRILSDEYSKDDAQDFALWKAAAQDEVGWSSPWGKGRPGWHIECSVMSQQHLVDTFDIHVGGIDLLFPHHENEIAQSEGKTGKPFVKYFIHGEHLLVNGTKMSKSLNNFYTLKDLVGKGFDPLAFRYLVLTAHYRDKLNFTWESLTAAQNALENLREKIRGWKHAGNGLCGYYHEFIEAVNNDLNTPQAVAVMWKMVKAKKPVSAKAATLLQMDQILGLNIEKYLDRKLNIPPEIQELIRQRDVARKNKNFRLADQFRIKIQKQGYRVTDLEDKTRVVKR